MYDKATDIRSTREKKQREKRGPCRRVERSLLKVPGDKMEAFFQFLEKESAAGTRESLFWSAFLFLCFSW